MPRGTVFNVSIFEVRTIAKLQAEYTFDNKGNVFEISTGKKVVDKAWGVGENEVSLEEVVGRAHIGRLIRASGFGNFKVKYKRETGVAAIKKLIQGFFNLEEGTLDINASKLTYPTKNLRRKKVGIGDGVNLSTSGEDT